ncbi:MAG: DUF479 domain-containing protein [Desulfuromonadaceae bacterium]|nr:DUF479 domain-containing protein [Desulfuromonadaceae bacterium]
MNYLLHLLFSANEADQYVGNLIGDFVKGPLTARPEFSPGVLQGLRHHRDIDSHAQQHPVFRGSCARLAPAFGRYRGILIDLFYDHFAACHWSHFHPQPLETFASDVYGLLQQRSDLPDAFAALLPRMIHRNWLVSYKEVATIERALQSVGQRLRRDNPLDQGIGELKKHYRELEQDSCHFIEDTLSWCAKGRRDEGSH